MNSPAKLINLLHLHRQFIAFGATATLMMKRTIHDTSPQNDLFQLYLYVELVLGLLKKHTFNRIDTTQNRLLNCKYVCIINQGQIRYITCQSYTMPDKNITRIWQDQCATLSQQSILVDSHLLTGNVSNNKQEQ